MCRGIVESDANSGGTGISSSINSGIVYLFTSTYILILIVGFFWYYRSKSYLKDQENKTKIEFLVGTMIELPRAAIKARDIAKHAEFFSFGTNDFTQTAFVISRDDSG